MGLRRPAPIRVERGEKLLADAVAEDAHLGGTRDALYVVRRLGTSLALEETLRIPWEDVQAADWDADTSTLRVSEVGSWGEPRPTHSFVLDDPARLLQLVRERVTATVLLQRHVPIRGNRGVRVIARRAPAGERDVVWLFEYDPGIDPDDPFVAHAAQEALAAARGEVEA